MASKQKTQQNKPQRTGSWYSAEHAWGSESRKGDGHHAILGTSSEGFSLQGCKLTLGGLTCPSQATVHLFSAVGPIGILALGALHPMCSPPVLGGSQNSNGRGLSRMCSYSWKIEPGLGEGVFTITAILSPLSSSTLSPENPWARCPLQSERDSGSRAPHFVFSGLPWHPTSSGDSGPLCRPRSHPLNLGTWYVG